MSDPAPEGESGIEQRRVGKARLPDQRFAFFG